MHMTKIALQEACQGTVVKQYIAKNGTVYSGLTKKYLGRQKCRLQMLITRVQQRNTITVDVHTANIMRESVTTNYYYYNQSRKTKFSVSTPLEIYNCQHCNFL